MAQAKVRVAQAKLKLMELRLRDLKDARASKRRKGGGSAMGWDYDAAAPETLGEEAGGKGGRHGGGKVRVRQL